MVGCVVRHGVSPAVPAGHGRLPSLLTGLGLARPPTPGLLGLERALVLPQEPIMGKLHSKSVILNYLLCGRLLMWQAQRCVTRQFHRPLM